MTIPMSDKEILAKSASSSNLYEKLTAIHPEMSGSQVYGRTNTLWSRRNVYIKEFREYENKLKVANHTVMIPATIKNKCTESKGSAFDDEAIFVKIHNDLRELIEVQKEMLAVINGRIIV